METLKNQDVFIAGVGVITSIGDDVPACIDALRNENAGIGKMELLKSAHSASLPVAEVKHSNEELAARAGLPAHISRTALLSLIAAREAWNDASLGQFGNLRTGFISANTVGGMDRSEDFFAEFLQSPDKGKLRDVVNHECGKVTEIVADALGVQDYVSTISTACSSGANSIFFAARLIKHGFLDVAIAGGADALARFTLNGFNTLQILDKNACTPFDENRKGLNLGEGAGYVVLVSQAIAEKIKDRLYARLSGYANANDAHHQTASSPDGTGSFMAMEGALKLAGLKPSDISYINLHGTGTANNDMSEGTAVKRLFRDSMPPVSSTKSFTGHTLGASGGVEAVFSVLAIRHGYIYPNLRFSTPIAGLDIVPEIHFKSGMKVDHVLSNSFGFGGNCSSLIFSKCER